MCFGNKKSESFLKSSSNDFNFFHLVFMNNILKNNYINIENDYKLIKHYKKNLFLKNILRNHVLHDYVSHLALHNLWLFQVYKLIKI